jgi:hypothetical protein
MFTITLSSLKVEELDRATKSVIKAMPQNSGVKSRNCGGLLPLRKGHSVPPSWYFPLFSDKKASAVL